MTVAKVIEVIGVSDESWEGAVKDAVREASKSIDGITGVEVINNTANVKDGNLMDYKATVKIAFGVNGR